MHVYFNGKGNGRARPSPAYEGGQTGLINASPEFGAPLEYSISKIRI